MKSWTAFAATSTFVASLLVAGAGQAETWDMPTPYPDKTFHTQNIIEFAKEVEAATNGELTIKVHSAGSLFKHPDIKNAVRGGQVPAGEFLLSLLVNENPVYGLDSLPFLATSYDDAKRLWQAQKPIVEKLFDEQGLVPLFSVAWPPQGLYTQKEIKDVSEFKGLKFRAYNATLEQFAQIAGAAPVQVEAPDIPQAFSTGRVEAMITSPSTGADTSAWDFSTHYTDIRAWIPKNIVVVNKRSMQRLDPAIQEALKAAGAKAEERGWQMSAEETVAKTEALKTGGMQVLEPSETLMNDLGEIGTQMLADWKASAGADGEAILSAY